MSIQRCQNQTSHGLPQRLLRSAEEKEAGVPLGPSDHDLNLGPEYWHNFRPDDDSPDGRQGDDPAGYLKPVVLVPPGHVGSLRLGSQSVDSPLESLLLRLHGLRPEGHDAAQQSGAKHGD